MEITSDYNSIQIILNIINFQFNFSFNYVKYVFISQTDILASRIRSFNFSTFEIKYIFT